MASLLSFPRSLSIPDHARKLNRAIESLVHFKCYWDPTYL